MSGIVIDISPGHITISALRYRLTAEQGTLGTRHAHGARSNARDSLDRAAYELAHPLAPGEDGESALGRE